MGTLRGDNGGERPQDGNGLPDLPPEWGTIVIPDDASALDAEGATLRRRFRQETRKVRWRRRLHLTPQPVRRLDDDSPGLAVPLLIMTIAVLATLTSLFAVAWPGQRRPMTNRPPSALTVAPTALTTVPGVKLSDLTLTDSTGAAEHLSNLVPAVILLVDDCACGDLIAGTAAAVSSPPPRQTVWVLVVGLTTPSLPTLATGTARVRALADATRSLRSAVPELAGGHPAAVLVGPGLSVVRALPSVGSVADFKADLDRLR